MKRVGVQVEIECGVERRRMTVDVSELKSIEEALQAVRKPSGKKLRKLAFNLINHSRRLAQDVADLEDELEATKRAHEEAVSA